MPFTLNIANPNDQAIDHIVKDLFLEYKEKYGDYFSHSDEEFGIEQFSQPKGMFLTLQHDQTIIAMGAYKPFDEKTAELKRIWTHPHYRKQGLGVKIVKALEDKALSAGYESIYLTTGFRQPEAVQLYLKLGYHPQFDIHRNFEEYALAPYDGRLRFTKNLTQSINLIA